MVFLVIIGIVVAVTLSYLWVKIVNWLIPNPKKEVIDNPYIKAQLIKDKNDRDYEEYIQWMEKNSSGVPFKKVMTKEELEAEKKIKNLF